jgi:hypothetical protein
MNQKSSDITPSAKTVGRDMRRGTRKYYSPEEQIHFG